LFIKLFSLFYIYTGRFVSVAAVSLVGLLWDSSSHTIKYDVFDVH